MAAEIPASPDPLTGTPQCGDVIDEKYRIERVLGVGGMGVVLEAWHELLHERVAIKVLQPALGHDAEALGRFEREARAIVRIKSEHVTRVLDVGRLPSKTPFIVMEYLEGRDLAQLLKEGYPFAVEEAIAHVLQACEVVAEAHSLGIVHRDLKPENLFLTRRRDGSSCIKVLDFGLSKVRHGDGSESRPDRALTAYKQAMGTPNYMSPEQWMSARDVGPAADQWALGAILYELLSAQPAFGGREIGQICAKVLNQSPASLTAFRQDVPPQLEQVILRSLEKDQARRFPSIYEFAAALAPFGSELSSVSIERVAGIFMQSSGEHPAPVLTDPSGRDGTDSGAPTVPRVRPAPGQGARSADASAAGSPDGSTIDHRPQTAQSWQQMSRGEGPSRTRSALLVAIAGGGVLLGALVIVAVMASSGPATEISATAGAPDGAALPTPAAPSAEEAAADAGASAEADAAAVGADSPDAAGSEPSSSPTAQAVRPRPRPPRPPRPKPTATKPSIFDSRQ